MEGVDERVLRYVEEHLKDEKVSGLDHSLRVLRWCELLAEGRDVDLETLRLAALLHDVSIPKSGRLRHYDVSADMAVELLR
ncbi:HD domain-containing protein, partial [Candidatus Bathyarchaeota archaeon]|nr:HD domain-containing protein [Candidatus Bathyarchaeota archaeon]